MLFLGGVLLAAVGASASQYQPHLPKASPWSEGWYTRIMETTTKHSIGIIVGYYPDATVLKAPSTYVCLVVDAGDGKPLKYEAHPKRFAVRGANGTQVVTDPDDTSPPHFSIAADDDKNNFTFLLHQDGGTQNLMVKFPEHSVSFEATLSEPETWGPGDESPIGRWSKVLPSDWFVYSLGSEAKFRFTSPTTGTVSGSGRAHQEKNWGQAFPEKWIWAEAASGPTARLSLTGSEVKFGWSAFLVGYRSEKLDWNFRLPTFCNTAADACAGTFEFQASSINKLLKIRMQVEATEGGGNFNVECPTATGFKEYAVENYRTNITVEAYSGLLHNHFEERAVFSSGALEFGGQYRCKSAYPASFEAVV